MSKNGKIILICLVLVVLISVIPLLVITNSDFGGADGKAEEAITEIDENYEPWFSPVIELPGGETESLLFSLQAAIGGGVFGFGMGYLVCRKKWKK